MVVRVHKARRHHAAHRLNHAANGRQPRPDGGHNAATQQHVGPVQFTARGIHRQDGISLADQDFGHDWTLSPPSV